MNLAERPSTLSIKLVKVWFALSLLLALFNLFRHGFMSWSLLDALTAGFGLLVLAHRYPWARIFTVVLLSINFAFVAYDGMYLSWVTLRSIHFFLTAGPAPNIPGYPPPDPQYLQKIAIVLFVAALVSFTLWLILDMLRNENTKKYFVSSQELTAEEKAI